MSWVDYEAGSPQEASAHRLLGTTLSLYDVSFSHINLKTLKAHTNNSTPFLSLHTGSQSGFSKPTVRSGKSSTHLVWTLTKQKTHLCLSWVSNWESDSRRRNNSYSPGERVSSQSTVVLPSRTDVQPLLHVKFLKRFSLEPSTEWYLSGSTFACPDGQHRQANALPEHWRLETWFKRSKHLDPNNLWKAATENPTPAC